MATDQTATEAELTKANCIIEHESRGNPNALNASSASGLFQIHWLSWRKFMGDRDLTDPFDPVQNGLMAGTIYMRDNRSFKQWTTNGLCK